MSEDEEDTGQKWGALGSLLLVLFITWLMVRKL